MPKTRVSFWRKKFEGNITRDKVAQKKLRNDNWRILIVWECETKNEARLLKRLERFFAVESCRR